MKSETGSKLKRFKNRYRLVVMNDDTYEEVATFKLSRMSVYVMLCTVFVVLVGLTVALIFFTPLKYYFPGAEESKVSRDLKYRADSLEKELGYQTQYMEGVQRVLKGDVTIDLDTMKIEVPKEEVEN